MILRKTWAHIYVGGGGGHGGMPSSLFLGENIFLKFRYRILNDQEVAPPPQFWRSMYKNWSEIKEKKVYATPCIYYGINFLLGN